MPYVDKSQTDSEETVYVSNTLACKACGTDFPSEFDECPSCGIYRSDTQVADSGPTIEGKKLTGIALEKVKSGGGNCPNCQKFYYNYDADRNDRKCKKCGAPLTVDSPKVAPKVTAYVAPQKEPKKPFPWMTAGIIALAVVVIFVVGYFAKRYFTTHDVNGSVSDASWVRTAHLMDNTLLDESGFDFPPQATLVRTESVKVDEKQNVIGQKTAMVPATTTPQVVGYVTGSYKITTTPEKIGTTTPEACSGPTPVAGGSVKFKQCTYAIYADPKTQTRYTDETPVYKSNGSVNIPSGLTPIYGTPTPVMKDKYYWKIWRWIDRPNSTLTASGKNNEPFWPENTSVDPKVKVVNDSQTYVITIIYANEYVETIKTSDPAQYALYKQGQKVVGVFNDYGGLNGHK